MAKKKATKKTATKKKAAKKKATKKKAAKQTAPAAESGGASEAQLAAIEGHLAELLELGRSGSGETERLEGDLQEARARIKELEAHVAASLDTERKEAREQIERLGAELGSAQERLQELEAIKAEVAQLREDQSTGKLRVAVLQERNGELMAQRAAVEAQIKRLEASFSDQRQVLEESLERTEGEAARARTDLTKAQETITALEEQLKESAETTAALRGEMSQVSRLRAELVAAEEKIEELRDQATQA